MNKIEKRDIQRISVDILFDIIGGIFIALGAYNFAAASHFPSSLDLQV